MSKSLNDSTIQATRILKKRSVILLLEVQVGAYVNGIRIFLDFYQNEGVAPVDFIEVMEQWMIV